MSDIQCIEESDMLSNEIFDKLSPISDQIKTGFELRRRFRPRFLMETSVLNNMKFPTPDSKYWQCNVERDTHFRNLVTLSFDYREKMIDIEILEEKSNCIGTVAMKKKLQVQIERENTALIYMRKEAAERVREILNWTEIMTELAPQLKYGVDDVEAHLPESFAARYANELKAMSVVGELQLSDTNGAMNILSVADSIFNHADTKKLIE